MEESSEDVHSLGSTTLNKMKKKPKVKLPNSEQGRSGGSDRRPGTPSPHKQKSQYGDVTIEEVITGSKSAPLQAKGVASRPTTAQQYQGAPKYPKKNFKVLLAVNKGRVYVPSKNKPRPEKNSFIETSEMGPPGAERRWLVEMKGFREDEIFFTLDGTTLKIEGIQRTRALEPSHHVETVTLPSVTEIEKLRVYRNKQIGTLILAYMGNW